MIKALVFIRWPMGWQGIWIVHLKNCLDRHDLIQPNNAVHCYSITLTLDLELTSLLFNFQQSSSLIYNKCNGDRRRDAFRQARTRLRYIQSMSVATGIFAHVDQQCCCIRQYFGIRSVLSPFKCSMTIFWMVLEHWSWNISEGTCLKMRNIARTTHTK